MPHQQSFTGHDGTPLAAQQWLPTGEPKAVVAILHGILEHGGRYAHLGEALAAHGYAALAMDHRGHGRSGGTPGHVRRFDDYVADAEIFLGLARQSAPEKPLFLFGHSMGAQIALLLVLERKPEIAGLILSGPVIRLGKAVFPVLRWPAEILSVLLPRLRLTRMGCRNISRDPQVVEAFRNDPLVFHGKFTVRIGAEPMRAARRIRRKMSALDTPLLVLHGTADVVADCRGSRELCRTAASKDKTLRLYEGLFHEVLSEPEREQVLDDLLGWLDNRTA